MTEFEQLLQQAGHRPARYGRKWHCAACPPEKAPSLSVGDDVFYCHRCQAKGNLVTLKKELGIIEPKVPKTPKQIADERMQFRIYQKALSILKYWQLEYLNRFRIAATQAHGFNQIGSYQLEATGMVHESILIQAREWAEREDLLGWQLNWIESQKPEDMIDLSIEDLDWYDKGTLCKPIKSAMNLKSA